MPDADGWLYLHTNGGMHFKRRDPGDFDESSFVVDYWPLYRDDPEGNSVMLDEALKLGAKPEEIEQLRANWGPKSDA